MLTKAIRLNKFIVYTYFICFHRWPLKFEIGFPVSEIEHVFKFQGLIILVRGPVYIASNILFGIRTLLFPQKSGQFKTICLDFRFRSENAVAVCFLV